jgi:hypothetical protein
LATYIGNPDPPVSGFKQTGAPTQIGPPADATVRTGQTIEQLAGFGAKQVESTTTELITLSTSTTVNTSTTNLLPANSIINAVLTECVVAIATATSYKVGDPTSDARFLSFTTSIGANQASLGLNQWNPAIGTTLALSAVQASATTVKITTAAATPPTAGKIRVTVFSTVYTGPTT